MSIERLNMLKNYLNLRGWRVVNKANDNSSQDVFEIVKEKIVWQLKHVDPKVSEVELHFFIFGELGRYSEDINDIAFCQTAGGRMLYFSKINSSEWRENHKKFVDQLFVQP